jgi:hypothetical protein
MKKKMSEKLRPFRIKKERHSEDESATFTSCRPLFGKKDLRGNLGHQSSTLRGMRADLSHRLGFFSIAWQKGYDMHSGKVIPAAVWRENWKEPRSEVENLAGHWCTA